MLSNRTPSSLGSRTLGLLALALTLLPWAPLKAQAKPKKPNASKLADRLYRVVEDLAMAEQMIQDGMPKAARKRVQKAHQKLQRLGDRFLQLDQWIQEGASCNEEILVRRDDQEGEEGQADPALEPEPDPAIEDNSPQAPLNRDSYPSQGERTTWLQDEPGR